MIKVDSFVFNPFSENTYVLSDETHECIIIDPGCYSYEEQEELSDFISNNHLKPVQLINTHCHIDHVLGNKFVSDKYKIPLLINKHELELLNLAPIYGNMYGVNMVASPPPDSFLNEGNKISFGISELKVLFTPGHSPGSISFYSEDDNFVISGDVLFNLSIGRTDLPGGDFNTLINSINQKLFTMPSETIVYSGHGTTTAISFEKKNNPFLNN